MNDQKKRIVASILNSIESAPDENKRNMAINNYTSFMHAAKIHAVMDKHSTPPQELSASEAVYGFASWLTRRPEVVSMGGNQDVAPIAELCADFIRVNALAAPRDGWHASLVHPVQQERTGREKA